MKSQFFLFLFFLLFLSKAFSQNLHLEPSISIDSRKVHENLKSGRSDCSAEDLVLEGPSEICPGEIVYVDLEGENNIPPGGGQGIGFTNWDNINFVISGMDFPYGFDNDINGILSANNMPPLEGAFTLYTVVFTNPNNVTGSICDDAYSIEIFFVSEENSICDEEPCYAQNLELIGPSEVCPGVTTSINTENPNTIPNSGGEGLRVTNNSDVDLYIPNIDYPFEFDNDLNGYLSENDIDSLVGPFWFGSFVYTDSEDPQNSICSQSGLQFSINFRSSIHPDCIEGDCFAQDPDLFGSPAICPNQTTHVNLVNVNTVPENGGEGLRFTNGTDVDFILPVAQFPLSFNGSLNGFLADNDIDPIVGPFQVTTVVYTDSLDVENSVCSESAGSIDIEFIQGDSSECLICIAQKLFVGGPNSLCPGEVTALHLIDITSIPTNGGQGLKCIVNDSTEILVPDVTFPFQLDNDLNGFLSNNNLDPFEGTIVFKNIIYTDPNDIQNTICSEGESGTSIHFLSPNDISCVSCELEELEILGVDLLCQDDTTVLDFVDDIIIPEVGGLGLHISGGNSGTSLWLDNISFPYVVDNDLGGYLSSNDMNPLQGSVLFRPYIYVDPNDPENSICVMGEPTEVTFLPENTVCPDECIVADPILTGPDEICEEETTTIDLSFDSTIPEGGGIGIRFYNGIDVNFYYVGDDLTFPFEFDSDLNGLLSGSGIPSYEGNFLLTSFIYGDASSPNSICAESENPVSVTFLAENHPSCVLDLDHNLSASDWKIFPNPASTSVNLQFETEKASTAFIQIIDLQGRRVKDFDAKINPGIVHIPIDLNGLAPGVYQVVLNISGKVARKPLLISN